MKSTSVSRIEMLTQHNNASQDDHPRVYEVYTSNDGNDWGAAVAMGEGDRDGMTVIDLSNEQSARFIRIDQTGSDSSHWWSIHNINLYSDSDNNEEENTENENGEEETSDNSDYNQTIDARVFSSESHPFDNFKVRKMGKKVGYIKNGTSISFDNFIVPKNNKPKSITITFSSAGAGGSVKVISESFNSNRKIGVTLGEFELSSTGGWNKFKTITFDLPEQNFEFNYIRSGKPLTLEFINSDSNDYLFDIVSFEINN